MNEMYLRPHRAIVEINKLYKYANVMSCNTAYRNVCAKFWGRLTPLHGLYNCMYVREKIYFPATVHSHDYNNPAITLFQAFNALSYTIYKLFKSPMRYLQRLFAGDDVLS